jgi:exodeoxyribonuclease V
VTVLSKDQEKALDQMIDWYEGLNVNVVHCNGASDCPNSPHTHGYGPAPVFALGGWAGSGKTTLMRVLDESIKGEAVFGTPTHKAANVLRKKLGTEQATRVRTYHSLVYEMSPIYRCSVTNRMVMAVKSTCICGSKEDDGCICPMSFLPCGTGTEHKCQVTAELKSERRRHLFGHRDVVIIDEASMLSKQHVEDVRAFGVPVILVGDAGQLPPIKDPMNPWIIKPNVELTEIHRQGADSGILQAAHDVRRNGRMGQAAYGSPKPDAVRMPRSAPQVDDLLMRFNPATDGALITYTNRLRAQLNRLYHAKLVQDGPVAAGDRVVSLGGRPYEAARVVLEDGVPRATGEFLHVHNGMTGQVLKAAERGVVTELTIQLDDHPLATADNPVVILSGGVPTAQFGAERELAFNAPERPRGTHLWDYAYALTAHKAQGSEFDKVIVADQRPPEYRQWMYTALTRARQGVVVVDWAA